MSSDLMNTLDCHPQASEDLLALTVSRALQKSSECWPLLRVRRNPTETFQRQKLQTQPEQGHHCLRKSKQSHSMCG
ncbi:Hypothetical predicted protein [Podarcis lilfordi]|uniref:Uncharacterized protein n=1 Tax=Podarcis lilfordi TaxID=74358 RepID=A0AA35P8L2_9SAUR|nr:Hypothetical predicted protein [Podarcis lilfordi]